jgi:hypothetical protein
MKLITETPWAVLTRAVKKCPDKCHVAVAYFGQGASKLLPLKKGSVLVLNFSEGAIKRGTVCPAEVLSLIKKGVEVHSVDNLHAKVFVIGQNAFVGSTNVSKGSAGTLIEAIAHDTSRSFVSQARRFVNSLRGEHISAEEAAEMQKLYRPPRMAGGRVKGSIQKINLPLHGRTWLIQLVRGNRTEEADSACKKGRPIAKKLLSSTTRFEEEDFGWFGGKLLKHGKPNDRVIQVLKESDGRIMVSPPERLLHFQKYKNQRGRDNFIVFLEKPKGLRRKPIHQVTKSLGLNKGALRRSRLLNDARLVHSLFQLWPKLPQSK